MNFPGTSEKIKRLRKKLKMNQLDLVDENLTRGFISMVEIGKRGVSKDTAEIIANKFNVRAKELGIELNIDADFILRDSRSEAEYYCFKSLEVAEKQEEIEKIFEIAEQYNLDFVKAKGNTQLGKCYFENHQYVEAFVCYTNALDYFKNIDSSNEEPNLYNSLGLCKINQLQFIEALTYFNLANYYANTYGNEDIKRRSIYNIALCNKRLGKIEEALKFIHIYFSTWDVKSDFKTYLSFTILKATCHEAIGLIDEAICILNKAINEFSDSFNPLLAYVYSSLGDFYLKKEMYDKSLECFNLSESIRRERDEANLSHTLIDKSTLFINNKRYEEAIAIINSGLELAAQYNDIEYLTKGYYKLVKIYISLKLYKKAEEILLKTVILSKNNLGDLIKAQVDLCKLYLLINDIPKLKESLMEIGNSIDN